MKLKQIQLSPNQTLGSGFEAEDGLSDVGGELGEVEDLRDSGAGDAGRTGNLGLV